VIYPWLPLCKNYPKLPLRFFSIAHHCRLYIYFNICCTKTNHAWLWSLYWQPRWAVRVGPFPVDFFLIVKTVLGWLQQPIAKSYCKREFVWLLQYIDVMDMSLISNRLLQNPITKGVLLSRPRALSESLLTPPPYVDGGAALEPATTRKWRGGALLCRCTKEEGAHLIWDPSDPWQRVGGGAAPGFATTCRKRGGALPCRRA
jgi:hypothetical protein